LSNYYPLLPSSAKHDSGHELTLGEVIDGLASPINTFVRNQIDGAVNWQWDPIDRRKDLRGLRLTIRDEEEQQILTAAIFGCIAAASTATLKGGGTGHDIRVTITKSDAHMISLAVVYVGNPISGKWWSRSPRYRQDPSTGMNTVEVPERRLMEVVRIATALGGKVSIKEVNNHRRHAIELLIPYLP
jgi:hypothetical protein